MSALSQFRRFAVVGAIAFAVDASVLQALVGFAAWSPFAARLVSFPVALTASFALNRAWTFGAGRSGALLQTYGAYTLVQLIGALLNLAVFSLCILSTPGLRERPVVALALGAAVALLFTFSASRAFVFRSDGTPR